MDTILIAEDDADARAVFSLLLEHHGYRVLEATDGLEAVRTARNHGPDVILMDIRMPVLDGWEATARLRADGATAGIPVVGCTAHARTGDIERSGLFDAYVQKPADLETVLSAVERVQAGM